MPFSVVLMCISWSDFSSLVCPDIVQLSWQRPLFTAHNGRGLGLLRRENVTRNWKQLWNRGRGGGGGVVRRGGGGGEEKMRRSSHFCEFETTEIKILAFTRFVDWEVASLTDALLARHAIFPAQVAT